jgi:hypothetical protein
LLLGALLAGSLQACLTPPNRPSAARPSAVTVPSAQATPAAPPPKTDGLLPALQLPESASGVPVSSDAVRVAISREALWIGTPWRRVLDLPPEEQRPLVGFGKRTKRGASNDLYVLPLAEAAKAIVCDEPRDPARAVLYVDATTPYRLLVETVFTLGHGFAVMNFGVATETGTEALPLSLTTASPLPGGTTVLVLRDGYRVSHPA